MRLTIRPVPAVLLALLLPARGDPPAWWHEGETPVIDPAATPNNQGPASAGQAKHMVTSALLSLDRIAPQVSAAVRTELAGFQPDRSDRIVDLEVPAPRTPEWLATQQAPLLLGQLKAIAHPLYNHLNFLSPAWVVGQIELNQNGHALLNTHYWQVTGNASHTSGGYFPWNPDTPRETNQAPANIGQLKAVFSLRFETDTNANGLPDLWEINHFALTGVDPDGDADGDGITNLNEYLNGSDPRNPNGPGTGPDPDGDGWLYENEIQAGGDLTVKDNPKVMLQVVAD